MPPPGSCHRHTLAPPRRGHRPFAPFLAFTRNSCLQSPPQSYFHNTSPHRRQSPSISLPTLPPPSPPLLLAVSSSLGWLAGWAGGRVCCVVRATCEYNLEHNRRAQSSFSPRRASGTRGRQIRARAAAGGVAGRGPRLRRPHPLPSPPPPTPRVWRVRTALAQCTNKSPYTSLQRVARPNK